MTDENNIFTARFWGFLVYVSNTTSTEELCFRDSIYTRTTIPNQMNITFVTHGRYVIYYNNRTSLSYPSDYSQYAYRELCEIEVYGNLTLDKNVLTLLTAEYVEKLFHLVAFLQKGKKNISMSCNVIILQLNYCISDSSVFINNNTVK